MHLDWLGFVLVLALLGLGGAALLGLVVWLVSRFQPPPRASAADLDLEQRVAA